MAILNGSEVRRRAAELAPRGLSYTAPSDGIREAAPHFEWLSDRTGIPVGTIHNATRDQNPQTISLPRVFDLARHLCRSGEDLQVVVAAITADEPKPDPKPEPKPERERDPSSPPPRKNGKDNRRGPRRAVDMRAAS